MLNNTGFNVGHWNVECETWYIERRRQILNGEAQPRVSKNWRTALRMTRAASRIHYHTNVAALDYVQSSFASPVLYVDDSWAPGFFISCSILHLTNEIL